MIINKREKNVYWFCLNDFNENLYVYNLLNIIEVFKYFEKCY